eukprot:919268-Rhodomonas_salina.3
MQKQFGTSGVPAKVRNSASSHVGWHLRHGRAVTSTGGKWQQLRKFACRWAGYAGAECGSSLARQGCLQRSETLHPVMWDGMCVMEGLHINMPNQPKMRPKDAPSIHVLAHQRWGVYLGECQFRNL